MQNTHSLGCETVCQQRMVRCKPTNTDDSVSPLQCQPTPQAEWVPNIDSMAKDDESRPQKLCAYPAKMGKTGMLHDHQVVLTATHGETVSDEQRPAPAI